MAVRRALPRRRFAAAGAREVYKYYYRLSYPFDVSEAGRPKRLSPAARRACRTLGAVFGTKNGWERADYFEPGEPWRRAGEEQRAFGWARPPFHDRVAVEHAAIRERVGDHRHDVVRQARGRGAGALALLERVCGNRIDRPVGSVVYTQLLDERGGIVGDVTVTRLAEDRFRVVTGAGAVDSDRGFLELHGGGDVRRDVTDELAVIGIWGPRARERSRTGDDVSSDVPVPHGEDDRRRRRARARAADHLRRRVRLRALRAPRRRGRRCGTR